MVLSSVAARGVGSMRRAGGPALWPRLWVLRRLVLVQSVPHRGSLGEPEYGTWFSLCHEPKCPAGRLQEASEDVPEVCCGRERALAVWEESLTPGRAGELTGRRKTDVFVCVSCLYWVEAAELGSRARCPDCRTAPLVKFGTPAED